MKAKLSEKSIYVIGQTITEEVCTGQILPDKRAKLSKTK